MNFFLILNIVIMYLSWKWATEAFDNGQNNLGWIQIFISAMNGAAVASAIF